MGQTTAGTTIAISLSLAATKDQAGVDALTPNLIGEVTNLGDYGRVYTQVTSNPLAERRTQKYKGSYNEGDPTITFNKLDSDAGQDDAAAALLLDSDVAIIVTHQNGLRDYIEAKVESFVKSVGDSDSMYEGSISLGINADILELPSL